MARLLSPKEFGLVAMAMVFIVLFNLVTDFGFKYALIQSDNNNQLTYSSVFYLNIVIGITLCSFIFLIAPLLAKFYEFLILEKVIKLLSITLIFNSFSIVQNAIFSKNLDFKKLSIRLIVAKTISAIVGITMALKDFGVYALVFQQITYSITSLILIWSLSSWHPSFVFSWTPIKKLYSYSSYIFFNEITNQIILKFDELIIGKLFSPSTLGFFGRANTLLQITNGLSSQSINSIFFPVLSKLQNDKERFLALYLDIYTIIILLSFYVSGVMIFSGETIIIGLFGEKWYSSVEIFQILMFKLFTYPTNSFIISALLSQGFSKVNFQHGLIKKTMRLAPFIIAYFLGFKAFLVTSVIIGYIGTVYNNVVGARYLGISFKVQITEFLSTFAFFIISILITVFSGIDFENLYMSSIVNIVLFSSVYFFFLFFFKRKKIKSIIKVLHPNHNAS